MIERHADNPAGGAPSAARDSAACDYCHLPLPTGTRGDDPVYCCLGCRLAADITGSHGDRSIARGTLARLGLAMFLSINVMMFTMALWTNDVYDARQAGSGPLAAALADLFRYLCLILSLPVFFLLGGPLVENALRARRRDLAAADMLILLGVAASFVYSAISVFRGAGHVYFEVGCAVLIAVTFGRWLEATGKLRTTEALDTLEKFLPAEARLVDRQGREAQVAIDAVCVGDHVRVSGGERFATDGRIVDGHAHVDEQLLTGESRLAAKRPGDEVLGGSLNADGELLVEVTSPPRGGSLARLIELVRQARASKGRYQRIADRVAAWFLSGVIALALVVFAVHTRHNGFERGLMAGLAVLLIACPCALGVATPLAVWNALAAASRAGVLFRNGEALERLAGIRAIRFDKTGTLTSGSPRVAHFVAERGIEDGEPLARAARLAAASTHAFSGAIARFAAAALDGHTDPSAAAQRRWPNRHVATVAGRGLKACFDDEQRPTLLGSVTWLVESGLGIGPAIEAAVERALARGESLSAIGFNGRVQGVFVITETAPRGSAAGAGGVRPARLRSGGVDRRSPGPRRGAGARAGCPGCLRAAARIQGGGAGRGARAIRTGGDGGRRGERRAGLGGGRPGHRHGVRCRRLARVGRRLLAGQRLASRGLVNRPGPAWRASHPPESVLGVCLQWRRAGIGGRRLVKSSLGRAGHGAQQRVRSRQLAENQSRVRAADPKRRRRGPACDRAADGNSRRPGRWREPFGGGTWK